MFEIESSVRSYCDQYPARFAKAKGAKIYSQAGKKYLDFLSGCGSLNYGHNHPLLKTELIDYIESNGISMALDMETNSKADFLHTLYTKILKPRGMDYKAQFTGPTGTNAVEAAIKLARKVTNRTNIIAFTNAFHGCTLGALSLTGNQHHRKSSLPLLNHVTRVPYDGYFGKNIDTASHLEKLLNDNSSGLDAPAAIILETIQGEGGLNHCSKEWLKKIERIAKKFGALLIIDDIQAGCGRSGNFFSFENFNISPDIILLAKSLSGYGLPMSMILLKPEIDIWDKAEHNGTFRGNNHAFVTAEKALSYFWGNSSFAISLEEKVIFLTEELKRLCSQYGFKRKGRGFMQGFTVYSPDISQKIISNCFNNGLIIEGCGPEDEVIKILAPLTITKEELAEGLNILCKSIQAAVITEKPTKGVANA